MKNLMNLKGAKILNRIEQKSINGGGGGLCIDECGPTAYPSECPPNSFCQLVPCTWGSGGSAYYCVGEGPGNQ